MDTPGHPAAGALAGLTVVLPRSADRAAGMAAELAARGARPYVMPLIDFEQPASSRDLDEALTRLGSGGFDWLVVTSITTVRALKQRAAALGTGLAALAAGTRVAAVGTASARALAAEGVPVDLVPEASMDAVGLVAAWPQRPAERDGAVLVPQADIAAPTVAEGLAAKGWQVQVVTAYHTVDYPARPERRLTAVLASAAAAAEPAALPELSVAEFGRAAAAGRIGAVVLTSPSLVRRLDAVAPQLPAAVLVVAIGNSTAREAARLGLPVAAVAALPTPAGIADALAGALAAAGQPGQNRAESSRGRS